MTKEFALLAIAALVCFVAGVSFVNRKKFTTSVYFETLAKSLGFRVVSTKYASGLVGEINGRRAIVLAQVRDMPTMHVAYGALQLYLETGIFADTDTVGIDKTLLESVPERMLLRSGISVLAGSNLELVMKEAYGGVWSNYYLVATPDGTTAEAIQKRFVEMAEWCEEK
jgi:hypothetical protein